MLVTRAASGFRRLQAAAEHARAADNQGRPVRGHFCPLLSSHSQYCEYAHADDADWGSDLVAAAYNAVLGRYFPQLDLRLAISALDNYREVGSIGRIGKFVLKKTLPTTTVKEHQRKVVEQVIKTLQAQIE